MSTSIAITRVANKQELLERLRANHDRMQSYGVRRYGIFGSFVRDELTPESDIDILLEFAPGVDPDLFELGGMQQELSDIFDREADLKTPDMFSPHSLQRIIASSVLAHAA